MNDQRLDSIELRLKKLELGKKDDGPQKAILAQFYAAEYSVFMGRVSSWENLQYAAWPILIAALALLAQMSQVPVNYRWWTAVISTLVVYVAYQGTMLNMLYSVLFVERDLRPQARVLIDTENFWIYERIRRENFPSNPAWSPVWPAVISFSAIGLVAGGLFYWHGIHWQDGAFLLAALILWAIIVQLTRNGILLNKQIVEACTPEVKLVNKSTLNGDRLPGRS
jgi:hypothetical protein